MRINGQRSSLPTVAEIERALTEVVPGLAGARQTARGIRRDITKGRGWTIVRHDGRRFDFASRTDVLELASALPTINPTASPEQHASAAARMLADMAD